MCFFSNNRWFYISGLDHWDLLGIISFSVSFSHNDSKDALSHSPTRPNCHVCEFSYFNLLLVFIHCRFGPLRQQWCMRFESKNAQMKSFISKCFKNVPLTVATHHQHWLCYHLYSNPNSDFTPFLYEGDQVSSGTTTIVHVHKRNN